MKANPTQAAIIDLILYERIKQDKKWGIRNQPDAAWLPILIEECGETAKSMIEDCSSTDLKEMLLKTITLKSTMDEVIQVAAVALAWLEDMATRN
jgi:trans-2-enoyl-CoA reductase